MEYEKQQKVNLLLEHIAESLDISDTDFEGAQDRYRAVGRWLAKDDSPLASYNPEIYPQGSFRLGTVVKPITDQDEYDIDLVCQLELTTEDVTQKQLKQMVGNRLKENRTYAGMLDREEGRRCWTLHYADGTRFHMDILPAVPDSADFIKLLVQLGVPMALAQHAICITDNTYPNYDRYDLEWPRSNPKGYAEWFRERMRFQFEARKKLLAEEMRIGIEEVPDYRVKTPLQRAIQLLKRHRDIAFANDPDDKPVSIIITTLAALAYNDQADLYDALVSVVKEMSSYIRVVNGVSWVPNPVNPRENFADKWQEKPQKEAKFRRWLLKLQSDLDSAFKEGRPQRIAEVLKGSFGAVAIQKALSVFDDGTLRSSPIGVGKSPEVIIRNPTKPWRIHEP